MHEERDDNLKTAVEMGQRLLRRNQELVEEQVVLENRIKGLEEANRRKIASTPSGARLLELEARVDSLEKEKMDAEKKCAAMASSLAQSERRVLFLQKSERMNEQRDKEVIAGLRKALAEKEAELADARRRRGGDAMGVDLAAPTDREDDGAVGAGSELARLRLLLEKERDDNAALRITCDELRISLEQATRAAKSPSKKGGMTEDMLMDSSTNDEPRFAPGESKANFLQMMAKVGTPTKHPPQNSAPNSEIGNVTLELVHYKTAFYARQAADEEFRSRFKKLLQMADATRFSQVEKDFLAQNVRPSISDLVRVSEHRSQAVLEAAQLTLVMPEISDLPYSKQVLEFFMRSVRIMRSLNTSLLASKR